MYGAGFSGPIFTNLELFMEKTALIMIDMQRGFLDESSPCYIAGAKATVPACAKVAEFCREAGVPVFFVTRLYRENGSDVEHTRFASWLAGGKPISPGCAENISSAPPAELEPKEGDYQILKPRFSAFFGTELDLILRRLGVRTLLLAGTTTPNCIRTTCYDGISLDYNIAVLSDCTSSATEEIQRANLLDMANIGAQILTSAELMSGAALKDSLSAAEEYARG